MKNWTGFLNSRVTDALDRTWLAAKCQRRGDQVGQGNGAGAGQSEQAVSPEGAPQISNGYTHGTIGRRRFQQKAAYVEPRVVVPPLRRQ